MSSRLRTVTIAIIFGLVGTLGVAFYVNSVKAAIDESGEKRTVFTAAAAMPEGTDVGQALSQGTLVKTEIPKRYTAENAVTSLDAYKDSVTVAALGKGEQMTTGKLRPADQSEVVHKLEPGKIALGVPIDDVTGVGGQIRAGDRVVVVATFAPGPGGVDISRVLLTGIEVLSVAGEARGGGPASTGQKRTITVAVAPAEAEKLVFAEEKGKVWMALEPAKPGGLPTTGGQTMESIFH